MLRSVCTKAQLLSPSSTHIPASNCCAGALRGVDTASQDACLFAESYVLETATAKLAGSEWQDTVGRTITAASTNGRDGS